MHRGLLLFAMQHPERRSVRAVARALSVSESTIRGWVKQKDWDLRCDGPEAEEHAVALYRRLYLQDHGPVELPEVADRVSVPMSANPRQQPPPTSVSEDIRASDQKVQREILRRRANDRAIREKHVGLVDGALGYVVKELQDGKIRASLRDIPTLLSCRALLTGEGVLAGQGADGMAAVETVRVRATREAGGDVLEAMYEDIEEFRLIIGVLRTRREVPIEVSETDAPAALSLVE